MNITLDHKAFKDQIADLLFELPYPLDEIMSTVDANYTSTSKVDELIRAARLDGASSALKDVYLFTDDLSDIARERIGKLIAAIESSNKEDE